MYRDTEPEADQTCFFLEIKRIFGLLLRFPLVLRRHRRPVPITLSRNCSAISLSSRVDALLTQFPSSVIRNSYWLSDRVRASNPVCQKLRRSSPAKLTMLAPGWATVRSFATCVTQRSPQRFGFHNSAPSFFFFTFTRPFSFTVAFPTFTRFPPISRAALPVRS